MPHFTLQALADIVSGKCKGDTTKVITGIAPIHSARSTETSGDITFLNHPLYKKFLTSTKAAAVILREEDSIDSPVDCIIVSDPYLAYAKVSELFETKIDRTPMIHPTAVISPTAKIDKSARIEAFCVVQDNVVIAANVVVGAHCIIGTNTEIDSDSTFHPAVTIYSNTQIGKRVAIHSGAVIGADGFGFVLDGKAWRKIPQLGKVIIGDDVEIGANTTIDRGALDDTIIENGAKLDNQIQVGHGVRIGEHTIIAGCVGIAGSTHIGRYCLIGGGVGIGGHLEITDKVTITGMAQVTRSITKAGIYSSGTALQTNRDWHKSTVRFRHLDEMARRIAHLEKQLGVKHTSHEIGNE